MRNWIGFLLTGFGALWFVVEAVNIGTSLAQTGFGIFPSHASVAAQFLVSFGPALLVVGAGQLLFRSLTRDMRMICHAFGYLWIASGLIVLFMLFAPTYYAPQMWELWPLLLHAPGFWLGLANIVLGYGLIRLGTSGSPHAEDHTSPRNQQPSTDRV